MDRNTALMLSAAACSCAVACAALWRLLDLRSAADKSKLLDELQRTKQALSQAKDELKRSQTTAQTDSQSAEGSRKPVRVYMDGCFDMMHYGHSNALRQAKAAGDILVVGLVADDEIVRNKGSPPVMNNDERHAALAACKWVDEIIPNVPYDLTEEWVNSLVKDHRVDFIVHGDDPCFTADGKDAYAYAKRLGVYRQVKRTEGVSTTDIVGRMLLMTKEHHVRPQENGEAGAPRERAASLRSSTLAADKDDSASDGSSEGVPARSSRMKRAMAHLPAAAAKFLPTARRIMQFAEGKVPKPGDRVVYVCGGWDLFNAGHIAALQEARKLGDFLLVGIHDDVTINKMRGKGLPILNLYERALSLLSCKYVDEIILGAPWIISEDLITTMNIAVVARGTTSDIQNSPSHEHLSLTWEQADVEDALKEAYAVPARMGILSTFSSPRSMTALNIVERILAQRNTYQARYEAKSAKEADYVKNKEYVEEA